MLPASASSITPRSDDKVKEEQCLRNSRDPLPSFFLKPIGLRLVRLFEGKRDRRHPRLFLLDQEKEKFCWASRSLRNSRTFRLWGKATALPGDSVQLAAAAVANKFLRRNIEKNGGKKVFCLLLLLRFRLWDCCQTDLRKNHLQQQQQFVLAATKLSRSGNRFLRRKKERKVRKRGRGNENWDVVISISKLRVPSLLMQAATHDGLKHLKSQILKFNRQLWGRMRSEGSYVAMTWSEGSKKTKICK